MNIIVLCTTDTLQNAKIIAENLVKENLAACVSIVNKVQSVYKWKGEVVEDCEQLLIIKTKKNLFEKLQTKIQELHPYEVPEIIAVDISEGSKPYLDWLERNTI